MAYIHIYHLCLHEFTVICLRVEIGIFFLIIMHVHVAQLNWAKRLYFRILNYLRTEEVTLYTYFKL